jgi:AraC-like DNA-binding protein
MKVLPFTIPKPKKDALILQVDQGLSLYEYLHQHEEIQLSYIKEGEGTLIVGDSLNYYQAGDVIILGSNLPHVFKSDTSKNIASLMHTVFFTKTSFGTNFFGIEELIPLTSFFIKSENGFKISSASVKTTSIFKKLHKASKLDRLILFFQLLKQINSSKYHLLSSFSSNKKYRINEGQRMSAIFEYTINNYHLQISLEVIAQEAAMTKNAFCKYFKKRTNKTYISFLNELRIEESCKLLARKNENSINDIAELCGFRNISNFNRRFKQIKQKSPRDYRKALN